MTSTTMTDGVGIFKLEFDVTGDPEETEYQVEAIATQGDTQETTTITLQR